MNCPFCKNSEVLNQGYRYNNFGKKQKYQCKKCKKYFIEDDGFKRMRHKKEIIVRAIHMHADGFSLFKTQYHLWQHDGIKVTRETINRWAKKYAIFLKSDTSASKTKIKRKTAF